LKLVRAHVLISGFVTGVNFRFCTSQKANSLGLRGWIRNLDDKVEVVFEGSEDKVKEMLEWCKKGPSFAKVDDMKIEFSDYKGEFEGFNII